MRCPLKHESHAVAFFRVIRVGTMTTLLEVVGVTGGTREVVCDPVCDRVIGPSWEEGADVSASWLDEGYGSSGCEESNLMRLVWDFSLPSRFLLPPGC